MVPAPNPDELQRLSELRHYGILDSAADVEFDDLTSLAAHLCDAPMAMVSFVDDTRQWVKSRVGLGVTETARDISFCQHTIQQRHLLVVPDAQQDPRFAASPLVTAHPRVRFYAGAPLITPSGYTIGTLCVMDRRARSLTPSQEEGLRVLGRQVMAQLDLRRRTREREESERRLLDVFLNCPVPFVIHRLSTRTAVDANLAFTKLLGWTRDDILGRTFTEIHIVDEVTAAHLRHQLALTGGFRGEDARVRTRDGELKTVLMSSQVTHLRGEPHALTTILDITARKEAELATAMLAAIVESSGDAIISTALDGTVATWNAGAERLFGYSREEMIGESVARLSPHEYRGEDHAVLSRIAAGEPTTEAETVRRTKDGQLIDVSVTSSAVRDSSGRLVGASKIVTDISRRKADEAALREERDRTQRYLDTAGVILLALDISGRVTRINRYGADLLGWDADDLVGRDFIEHCVPERLREETRNKLATVQIGDDTVVENPVVTQTGDERLIEWRTSFLRDDHGTIVGTFSSGADVTDRRDLEAQFQQAQKMDAVGRLASGVAHDFNNLLTAILGYARLILDDDRLSDSHRADLGEIERAGERAATLTQQLLAFSRKKVIAPATLNLNDVVLDIQPMLGRLIGEHVRIALRLSHTPGLVRADRGQIEQIIVNLAVNARDAMTDGGTLTIQTMNVELDEHYATTHFSVEPGSYVALIMTDTGSGMSHEVQARLFEPFFTTKEVGKGTGLGLATVHGIVKRSGGSITVYSEPGKGTAFNVYFPQTDEYEQVGEAPKLAHVHRQSRTILVVEDSEGLRTLTKRVLEMQGYTVHVAGSATEAMRIFDEYPDIDVLLTDVIMPGASGPALTRDLVTRRPELRVIFMSGYTEDAIAHLGVLQPGVAFINKPFTAQTLGQKIQELLDT